MIYIGQVFHPLDRWEGAERWTVTDIIGDRATIEVRDMVTNGTFTITRPVNLLEQRITNDSETKET